MILRQDDRANRPSARRSGQLRGGRPTWLVAPATFVILLVVVVPVLLGLYIAFFKVDILTLGRWYRAPFVGLGNFIFVLTDTTSPVGSALSSVVTSVKFAVLTTLIATPIGVAAALTASHRFRGRAALRSCYLVPYVVPIVVTAVVGRMMFLNGTGLVDRGISVLGLPHNTYWLLGPNAFWAMLIMEVWTVWPFTYLLILAGLTAIPIELYEAVELDGGRHFAKIRYIVLPHVRGLLGLSMVLSTIFHLGNFTLPFVMFNNPPPPSVAVLPIDVYYRAFASNQFGEAAAAGIFMIVVFALPAYAYIRASRLRQSLAV